MRRTCLLFLLLAACSSDPVRLIPAADRNDPNAPATPITVEQMLARARTAEANPGTVAGRLLVRFEGDAVAPNDGQRAELRKFAAAALAASRKLLVSSRPGSFDDAGAPVLGQRRAVAVARELTTAGGDVDMKFDPALPPAVVVVTQGMTP